MYFRKSSDGRLMKYRNILETGFVGEGYLDKKEKSRLMFLFLTEQDRKNEILSKINYSRKMEKNFWRDEEVYTRMQENLVENVLPSLEDLAQRYRNKLEEDSKYLSISNIYNVITDQRLKMAKRKFEALFFKDNKEGDHTVEFKKEFDAFKEEICQICNPGKTDSDLMKNLQDLFIQWERILKI